VIRDAVFWALMRLGDGFHWLARRVDNYGS
jgi:hypothetical protein